MRALIVLSIIAIVVAVSAIATATTLDDEVPPSPAVAAAPASVEVTGVVRTTKSSWQGKRIVTRVVLDTSTGEVAFVVPGGSIDGIAMSVTGMPTFIEGEHTRVRLRSNGSGYHFTGFEGGKVILP